MFVFILAAWMLGHTLPFVPDLDNRLTGFQRQALPRQLMGNRVPVMHVFNVIIRADFYGFELSVFIRCKRQRRERRRIQGPEAL